MKLRQHADRAEHRAPRDRTIHVMPEEPGVYRDRRGRHHERTAYGGPIRRRPDLDGMERK